MVTPNFGMFKSLEKAYLNYLDRSYTICYVYIKCSTLARTKIVGRKQEEKGWLCLFQIKGGTN